MSGPKYATQYLLNIINYVVGFSSFAPIRCEFLPFSYTFFHKLNVDSIGASGREYVNNYFIRIYINV